MLRAPGQNNAHKNIITKYTSQNSTNIELKIFCNICMLLLIKTVLPINF